MLRLLTAALMAASFSVFANESLTEKTSAKTNDMARSAKKMAHRAQEKVCAKGDAECLKQKAEHRAQEAKDYTTDKAQEVNDAVDSDGKAGQ